MLLSLKKKTHTTTTTTTTTKQIKRATTYNSPLFTSQMEMLSGNCSEWSTARAYIPYPTVTIVKWCQAVMETVRQHQEGGRWIKKLTNILTSEAILQTSWKSMRDHSCRNIQRLTVAKFFPTKAPPQTLFWALNKRLYIIWLTYQKTCVTTKKLYKQKRTIILT